MNLKRRLLVLLALACAAALAVVVSSASAEPAPGSPPPPPCEAGQIPNPEHPCQLPKCAEGQVPTREKPCIRPGEAGPPPGGTGETPGGTGGDKPAGGCGPGGDKPSGDGPKPPTGDGPGDEPTAVRSESSGPGPGPGSGPGAGDCRPPDMARGFMNRVWKFNGEVDGFDDGVLSITVSKILNLPKKFSDERAEIVDEDARVLVSSKIRVYDKDGHRTKQSDLDDAENVRVQGKMLATGKWQKDEDGQPVPTIRAKKIYILG